MQLSYSWMVQNTSCRYSATKALEFDKLISPSQDQPSTAPGRGTP
jgi:hypothetical protein